MDSKYGARAPAVKRGRVDGINTRVRAVCVLGCRAGSAALARRTRAGRDAFLEYAADLVVACGGRAWDGRVEADEIARMLKDGGIPESAIVRERCSLDTRDNARFAAELLARRGVTDVLVVTCAWHLPRAKRLFERAGLSVEGVGVPTPEASILHRAYVTVRERLSTWKDARRS
jgi:uncharacterized SAM-binding protein YcdF (DUF218 family)